jgi:hypothetical protein
MRANGSSSDVLILLAATIPSVTCAVNLWLFQQRSSLAKKVVWTLILAAPIIGPLLYVSSFEGGPPRGGGGGDYDATPYV